MAQRYALFFDIDGTLVSFKTHEIPPSAILALTQAKANGSRVYIATGRPPIIITNLGAIEHLIDGYITTNGALCYVGDEMVCCQPIAKDDVMTCVDDAREKDYSLIVVGRKDVAVLDPTGDVDRIFRQMLAVKNLDKASPLDVVLQQDILQLTPFFPADYEPQLMARMTQCVSGRWQGLRRQPHHGLRRRRQRHLDDTAGGHRRRYGQRYRRAEASGRLRHDAGRR